MAMVGVVSGSLYRRTTHSLSRLAWSWVSGRLAPFSSNEPGELSQWLSHDDSTINIVVIIIIIIIIEFKDHAKNYQYSSQGQPTLRP